MSAPARTAPPRRAHPAPIHLLDRFLPRLEFASYEDFRDHYRVRLPRRFNFTRDVLGELAARAPDQPALVWCDDHGHEAAFTFAQVNEGCNRALHVLRACGIRKGDPVLLILKRRHAFWFLLPALHQLGAVAIPATHLLTAKDLVYRLRAAAVRAVVCVADPALRACVEDAERCAGPLRAKLLVGGGDAPGWTDFDRALAAAPARPCPPQGSAEPANQDTSLLYFTSGTTGMPKMVRHNFLYPLGHILTARYWQRVQPGGLHLTVADTGWAKAAWGKIYGQWLAGSAVLAYDYDKFAPARLLRVLQRYDVTTFCAPPTIFRFLIREHLAEWRLPRLQHVCVAGEPLNPEVYHQFLRATGLPLHEGYGQTELTVTVGAFAGVEPRPGSMGRPAPGMGVELIDDSGRACGPEQEGEIVLRFGRRRPPVGVFQGYHRDPALTRTVWHGGTYHTGDIAWRDKDGYLWFVGRADDVIKSSGYRIGPFEVESALLEHPAVVECAVTGQPDPARGQVVKASVVLAPGYTPGDALAAALQAHVKQVTAPYKYPRVIEFVRELPKTISGKIRRVAIRKNADAGG
jgi:acetyl-CoA synthetase